MEKSLSPIAAKTRTLVFCVAVWLVGDARARAMRPICVGANAVRLECGIQMEAVVLLSTIESIAFSNDGSEGIAESDRLNYGTFYRSDAWIITKRPVKARTLSGTKRVRAIGMSVDDPKAFAAHLTESLS